MTRNSPRLGRIPSILTFSLAAFVLAAACGGGGGQQNSGGGFKGTKKVGYSGALTGQSALYGKAVSQTLKLAMDDLNAKGGVNGYKMEPVIYDDGTTVDKATANFRELILQDNVQAAFGPVTSAQCQATSPIAKQNKTLFLSATCNSYQLSTEPDLINPYFTSVVPNTYMEGTAAGRFVAKLGSKRIFIVSPKYLFGVSETNAFVASLKRANPSAQIVNPESTWYVPFPTNPRWDSTINAIQSFKPDLIYTNIFAADEINFVQQAQQVDPDFFKKYPFVDLSSVDELRALGNAYPLGMHLYMRAPFFAINNQRMNDFVKRYKERFNEEPSDWAVLDYDAAMMWGQAANAAKSFDADKVIKQIVGHSFQSLRGYSFTIRAGDQQADVGETIGTTADSGGKYKFPILKDAQNLKGSDLIMPKQLMQELRDGKCEKDGNPTTTDFALCPSWKQG
ncbi:MAG: ABC transporter substrate-binding protein [Candidatus Dormibacteraeota bacterium]|uniref:ABC transporter substrate-binding protein n=1 Tax=Candidatus Dormiibacter inghamiae TaxID=3127013 RepID=A0A934KCV2_9BACT|nr:ABC transporter substrate-binding protein [Candidatus Dormibacteraeota bacterium]MBJ7605063.1 ABC transporter substrate-binding protein [Candidatus Dormibacteraeota bacterium]